jgi:hypothetical protein
MDEKNTQKRRIGIPRPGGDCVAPGKRSEFCYYHVLFLDHIYQQL